MKSGKEQIEMLRAYINLERAKELREFWPSGQPIRVLAERWGCTIGYISIKAKELGLPSRQMGSSVRRVRDAERFVATCNSHIYFQEEAARRGMTPRELEALVLQVVANDRMVTAVLDDEADESHQTRIHA